MKHIIRIVVAVLPVLAIVLVILQVVVSNELAGLGKHLGKLDQQVSDQQDIAQMLETQVASASSLFALRNRAIALGFHEPARGQVIALGTQVPVAFGIQQTPVGVPLQ